MLFRSLLVINNEMDGRTHMEQAPLQLPFGELLVRYEPDSRHLFISTKHFRDWCTKNQASYKAISDALEKDGVATLSVKKRLARGTKLNTPAVNTMVVDTAKIDGFDVKEFIANGDSE